jgi:hypothetical protein
LVLVFRFTLFIFIWKRPQRHSASQVRAGNGPGSHLECVAISLINL